MKKLLLLFIIITLHAQNTTPIKLINRPQEGGGFYAEIHKIVQNIIHFENQLVAVEVDWTDEFFPYKDGAHENGWNLFFEPIPVTKKVITNEPPVEIIIDSSAAFHELHDQTCISPWINYKAYLPYRKFINRVLTQYIHLKPHVSEELDRFYESHMQGFTCIGVHARIALQHRSFIPGNYIPTYQEYFKEIDTLIKKHADQPVKIFVASDSHEAINKFKEHYGDKVIYINAYRNDTNNDPCIFYTSGGYYREHKEAWHKNKHRYFGGLTTILDCMLLSRCDYLIHTTSNLAFFATYYNPEIESIYLPKGVPNKPCTHKNDPEVINPYLNPT